MKRVIVTGGTGFVGANLIRRLLREGHEVHLLVRPDHQPWRIEPILSDLHLHQVHLQDTEAVSQITSSIRPDWIFHLAVYGAYSWQNDWQQMVLTNIQGTMSLVSACLKTGFEAFVNTGSSSEYGFKDHPPSETEPLEPSSHYAVTKAAATLFCRYTAQSHHVHLPTLRLYSVYGPFEDPGRLIPTLIRRGLKGELPPLVDPNVARDLIFVEDVVEAYLLAAQLRTAEWGPVFNVGTGIQTTIREVVTAAQKIMSISAQPLWNSMPNRNWDTNVWVCNNHAIQHHLGWKPRVDFPLGLSLTVDWFSKEGSALYLKRPC